MPPKTIPPGQLRAGMLAGLSLSGLVDEWSPGQAKALRASAIKDAASINGNDSADIRAWIRATPINPGGSAFPWWSHADIGLDRQRYDWDPDDLVAQMTLAQQQQD